MFSSLETLKIGSLRCCRLSLVRGLLISETVCSSSSMKPPLPKPGVLRGGAPSNYTGALFPNGEVLYQQSAVSSGLSAIYGNGDLLGDVASQQSASSSGLFTRHRNQGFLGDVVSQQSGSSNGLSASFGNPGLSVDQNYLKPVMGMSEPGFRPPATQQQPPVIPKPVFLTVDSTSIHTGGGLASHGNQPSAGFRQSSSSAQAYQNHTNDYVVTVMPEPAFRPPVSQQQPLALPKPGFLPVGSTSSYRGGSGLVSHGNRPSIGNHQSLSSVGPSSSVRPPLPKSGVLCGDATSGGNGGLVSNGNWPSVRNQRSLSLVVPSSSMKPPLPKSGSLCHATTDGNNGGLVSRGNAPSVVCQQVPSSSSPSVIRGNQVLTLEESYLNQRRWLLFLKHARECSAVEGKCLSAYCGAAKQFLKHCEVCTLNQCPNLRCRQTKGLFQHYRICRRRQCPVCVAVRSYIQSHKRKRADLSRSAWNSHQPTVRTADFVPQKQMKTKHLSAPFSASCMGIPNVSQNTPNCSAPVVRVQVSGKHEVVKMKSKHPPTLVLKTPRNSETEKDKLVCGYNVRVDGDHPGQSKKGSDLAVVQATESKLQKLEVPGLSFIDFFAADQIQEHINSLRKWTGIRKANAAKKKAMECSTNLCQLCAAGELHFGTLPMYCSVCNERIKENHTVYSMRTGEESKNFCKGCYKKTGSDTIEVNGTAIPKAKMEKRKNNEKTAETWVECGTCKAWQHQICALFNARRDVGGQAEYTCPICCIGQIERGDRKPLPQSSNRGAKDLPTTILSDYLEKRLFERLKQEREQRAKLQGKKMEDVPGAEGLVLRVVSSVDKKMEVQPNFLKIFEDQNYPKDFPCKSKAILLFQSIEGVEVCLFGMFVHEYGSECPAPNQRRVYLSYLDSVKYFRPEIAAVTGEALRTFVYHEILIGYLDYCKTRGFTSCYIWACPPEPCDNYILYCHPKTQKTPDKDKLKNWYESMIQKAIKEKIVVDYTNLYEHFFGSTGDPKAKVTAASLPYFDGDHWPRVAEAKISELQKIKRYTGADKRDLKAAGLTDFSGNAPIAYLLMQSIEKSISSRNKDFIMVHLQHACSHCRELMVSGSRWVCKQCEKFQLCDKCHDAEEKLDERHRHPSNSTDKHAFQPLEVRDVPVDTKDGDRNLECEIFDTRTAFLGLCQKNQYQYDTLRRAKHSSMMLLYHLHNPTEPLFIPRCIVCHNDVQAGQGWQCETCKDYDVCNTCFGDGRFKHPHKLTNQSPTSDHHSQKGEARRKEKEEMLILVAHCIRCEIPKCPEQNCRELKRLFLHGTNCKTRATGGCQFCMKVWSIIRLHAWYCQNSECQVPRCKNVKKGDLKRKAELRRRAVGVAMETAKPRNADVAEKENK